MAYKLIKSRATPLTVSLAEHHLSLKPLVISGVSIDRDYKDSHTLYLTRCMNDGRFAWERVQFVTAECTKPVGGLPAGTVFRLNGKHTCNAMLAYAAGDKTLRHDGPVTLHYQCEDVEDMRALFRSIDRGLARTSKDIIVATMGGSSGFESVPKQILTLVCQGLRMWVDGDKPANTRMLIDDAAESARGDFRKIVKQVIECGICSSSTWGRSETRILLRSPCVAAMYATFAAAGPDATKFWTGVRDCLGIESKHDPRYVLHNYLREATLVNNAANGVKRKDKRFTGSEGMYRCCILAWNKWCSGEEMARTPAIDLSKERPEVLTPKRELQPA